MAFTASVALRPGISHTDLSARVCRPRRPRTSYFVNARAAASPAEIARKEKAEAEAKEVREVVEASAIDAVVSGTAASFQDGRYGTCFVCGEPVVIPGLNHVYCKTHGWVPRPAEKEDVELPGHHD